MGAETSNHRRILFDEGAEAFSQSRPEVLRMQPDLQGWYVCPLCLRAFPLEALSSKPPQLTVDEAPPKASTRGPITKVLTCMSCNNQAGWRFEGELKKRRIVEDFVAGRLANPAEVHFEAGDGSRIRAQVTSADGSLAITGVPEATNPDDLAAHSSWWDKLVDEAIPDAQFTIHMMSFDHVRSQVALLKTAYLVAFAAFGYTYIWRPQLDPVREAIKDPRGGHILRLPILTVGDQDPTIHRILAVAEPLRGLSIEIGLDFVILPWLDSPSLFWERIDELAADGTGTFTFDAAGDWPRFPEYRLDLPRTDHGI